MTNRVAAAGAAVLAALAVSGCGAVPAAGAAATVGDDDISVDDFERLLGVVTEHEDLFGIAADPTTDTVQAAAARSVLTLLVQGEITEQFLVAGGESITDADRQAVIDSFGEEDPLADLPDDVAATLVDSRAGAAAVARVPARSAEELQALYEESREDLGIVCVRHVQVSTQEEAQAVLDELEAGASIEELATEHSTEASAATTGGAVQAAEDVDCAPIAGVAERFGVEFAEAAVATVAGSPSEPVQSSLGWHVVEAQAAADVAEDLVAIEEQVGAQLQLAAFTQDLDVSVDPRYGRWDPLTGSVGALT